MIDRNVFVRNTDVMQNLTKKILIINISIAYQFHLPYFINYGLFNFRYVFLNLIYRKQQ